MNSFSAIQWLHNRHIKITSMLLNVKINLKIRKSFAFLSKRTAVSLIKNDEKVIKILVSNNIKPLFSEKKLNSFS